MFLQHTIRRVNENKWLLLALAVMLILFAILVVGALAPHSLFEAAGGSGGGPSGTGGLLQLDTFLAGGSGGGPSGTG